MPDVFDRSMLSMRNAFPLASAVPQLVDTAISHDGQYLVLKFDQFVIGNAVPTITMSGGSVIATYHAGSGTQYILFVLSRTVSSNEFGTLDLAAGGYLSVFNWANKSVTGFHVDF